MVKNPPAYVGDPGSIPGSERSPGERNGNPLQYSCLENFTGRGAWRVTVHGVTKRHDWATDTLIYTLKIFNLSPPPRVSPVAQWSRICLQCKKHRRLGFHSWAGKSPCRRKWQPTPVFLPGEAYWQRGLAGYSDWSRRVRHDWSNWACHIRPLISCIKWWLSPFMEPPTWGTLQRRAALSWYKRPNLCWCHVNVCKGKRAFHLWPHGVRWRQGIKCSPRQVFRRTRCLHNSDKGSPGNCKFDSTYSSHACLWRPGGFELQEKKKKKPRNECELTEWIHSGDWQVDDNYS